MGVKNIIKKTPKLATGCNPAGITVNDIGAGWKTLENDDYPSNGDKWAANGKDWHDQAYNAGYKASLYNGKNGFPILTHIRKTKDWKEPPVQFQHPEIPIWLIPRSIHDQERLRTILSVMTHLVCDSPRNQIAKCWIDELIEINNRIT